MLAALQTLDPPGVFARSLAECLALQLKEQNRYDPIISRFLENLHLLAGHNFPALRKAVGCEMDELLEIIAEIKKLNPKPGLKFGSVQMQPVVPDVLVRSAHRRHVDHRAQHRHAAARAGQSHLPHDGLEGDRARRPTATICSNACRPPTGW